MLWRLKYEPWQVVAQRALGKLKANTTAPIKKGQRVKFWNPDMYEDESRTKIVPAHWSTGRVGKIREDAFEVIDETGYSYWAFPWDYGESLMPY